MLGQPMFLPQPIVVGVRVSGALPAGTTATDLVLTLSQMLRAHGVVGKFVEFFGPGCSTLELADRATLSNMCPEYGATSAFWPVDDETLRYLRFTGREDRVDLVERYTKEQELFRTDADPEPVFTEVLDLDLSSVEPSMAGPKRPQDRVPLTGVWESCIGAFRDRMEPAPDPTEVGRLIDEGGAHGGTKEEPEIDTSRPVDPENAQPVKLNNAEIRHGSVVIAAITSCTNTSNPTVMIAAGLLAKRAVEAGLESKPWVKTSLAPGSRVVTDYLDAAGLQPYLDKLGFSLVGFGCTTCIGNSGPLPDEVANAVQEKDLAVVAVLSGNRNFEGRIHPLVRASYLASPPLCVAYALTGHIETDLTRAPLGVGHDGSPVYLRDLWPSAEEVQAAVAEAVSPEQFKREYGRIFAGDDHWNALPSPTGPMFAWDPASTYVREPPFFEGLAVFDAAFRYRDESVPLLVIAGKEYGSGSSRDWAAKGPALLGIRAVLAESFERIHRSNLVGMGVLPLQFAEGQSAASLGLTGRETFTIGGLAGGIGARQEVRVRVRREDGSEVSFPATVRIDMPAEVDYYRHGGILQMVLRHILAG